MGLDYLNETAWNDSLRRYHKMASLHGERNKMEERATKLAVKHHLPVGSCGIISQSVLA